MLHVTLRYEAMMPCDAHPEGLAKVEGLFAQLEQSARFQDGYGVVNRREILKRIICGNTEEHSGCADQQDVSPARQIRQVLWDMGGQR